MITIFDWYLDMMQYFGINLLKYVTGFILMSDHYGFYSLSSWFKIPSLVKEFILDSPITKSKTEAIEKS